MSPRGAALGLLLATAACYSPTIGDGQYTCGTSHLCPSGFSCNACGSCVKEGEPLGCAADLGQPLDATPPPVDATMPLDTSAPLDGTPRDAAPLDATFDGVDGAVLDLAAPDSTPPVDLLPLTCDADAGCLSGSTCCGGVCVVGDCCASADCEGGQVCTANHCSACTGDGDCAAGLVCTGGACLPGCDVNVACGGGAVCCASTGMCASAGCTGSCLVGNCCDDTDCTLGTRCAPDHTCSTPCSASTDCSSGSHCCTGIGFCSTDACVATVAGNGRRGSADAPAASALVNGVFGSASAPDGSLYFTDLRDGALRLFNRSTGPIGPVVAGNIGRVAGGIVGCKPGPALGAEWWSPWGVTRDASGNLYVADAGCYVVWKVSSDLATVSLVAGQPGVSTFADGPAATATFVTPTGVAFDPLDGALYVTDFGAMRVRRIDLTAATVTTVAGTGAAAELDGAALSAKLLHPISIAVAGDGGIIIGDWDAQTVRRLIGVGTASPQLTTILAPGKGYAGLGSFSVALDGRVYLPLWNGGIWQLVPSSGTYSLSQITSAQSAMGVSIDGANAGTLWVGGWVDNSGPLDNTIVQLSTAGAVQKVYGQPHLGQVVDGAGTAATFDFGTCGGGLARDSAGTLWVADRCAHRLRRIAPDGTVTSFGSGVIGEAAGDATHAQFCLPDAILAVGTDVYVVDSACGRAILKIAGGTTASLVGKLCVAGEPGCLVAATPPGIAADSTGNLYVSTALEDNVGTMETIVKIPALGSGTPAFFAGTKAQLGCTDGALGTGKFSGGPYGLAVDASGHLYAADATCGLRAVSSTGSLSTLATGPVLGLAFGPLVNASQTLYASNANAIFTVDTTSGKTTPYAGGTTATYTAHYLDGPPANALLWEPATLVTDGLGDVFFLDQYNSRIRVVYP